MNRTYLCILAFLLLELACPAQWHDNTWLMGLESATPDTLFGGMTLRFDGQVPSEGAVTRPLNFQETVCSMSDSLGSLLFYTNGTSVYSGGDELLENGDGLSPGIYAHSMGDMGLSFPQSVMSLPVPGHPWQYYLFQLRYSFVPDPDDPGFGDFYGYNTLYLHRVDMAANGGSGAVVEKNKVLKGGPHTEELFDWPTATRHANGRDWWLVMPSDTGSVYHVFLATPEGVEDRGSQYLPYPYPTPINRRDKGQNVFTLMGDRYVDFDMWGLNIRVYDFDRCTGELDNIRWLDISANISQDSVLPNSGNDRTLFGGGAAISPSGRFLYIDQGRTVYQLDLEAEDFRGSIEIVAEYDGYQSPYGSYFYLMQLGPDGRIYINSTNGENVMHVIDRPNEKGLACDVRQHSLHLPRYNYRSMPHYPNYRLSPLDGSPCDTLGLDNHPLAGFRYEVDTLDPLQVEFIDNSFYEPTDWLWDFGGTGSSTEVNPVYTFPSPGTYIVCLTVSNQYDSGTFCREVEVEVTGVEEKKDENFAAIYPNPASGEIHLYLRLPGSREAVLSLYVVTGRKVREWKVPTPKGASGQHGHTFPVAGLAEGMYFWKVEAEGGRVQSGKLIISR